MDALLGRRTMAGLAANDNGDALENRRLETTLGYGFPAFGDRFTHTPQLGVGLSNGHRQYSLGWRLARDPRRGDIGSLEFALEARRRERRERRRGTGERRRFAHHGALVAPDPKRASPPGSAGAACSPTR